MLDGLEDETFANPLNDKTHPLDRTVGQALQTTEKAIDTLGTMITL